MTGIDLEDHLAETVPDSWLPDVYEIVAELPKASTGKFDKKRLRERFDIVLEAEQGEEAEP